MIKVVNLVALIIAPIVVTYKTMSLGVVIFIVLLIAGLVWAITQSKKPAPPSLKQARSQVIEWALSPV